MKYILFGICLCFFICSKAQNNYPKLELYAAPGFFLEQLSTDSLIPARRRNSDRLGDVTSYAAQVAIPFKNKRWLAKAGVGLSQRHYSINKYSLDDFFIAIFSFDSPPRRDSFNISYVRFTNNYLQTPFSVAYMLTKPYHNLQASVGLNLRADFLTKSKPDVRFDSAYKIPTTTDFNAAQKAYTENASKFVFTAEPYLETAFKVYKNVGAFVQFRPFSFYTSKLDKRLTTSTVELFSFTFGASYSLK